MGITSQEVEFAATAPDLAAIAATLERLTGLAVTAEDSSTEIKGTLYAVHGHLAFACAPRTKLEVYAYHPGAARVVYEQAFGELMPVVQGHLVGAGERPDTQCVHLQGFIGEEPTLFCATALALESLGGRLRHPIADDARRKYGGRVEEGDLRRRHRHVRNRGLWLSAVAIPMLAVLVPLWIAWAIVSFPWTAWKGWRNYRAVQKMIAQRNTARNT